jgi:hypothetical protein
MAELPCERPDIVAARESLWHIAAFAASQRQGRYWVYSGQTTASALISLVVNDPTATLAVHRGNGFDAGFSPYQSTRLNR